MLPSSLRRGGGTRRLIRPGGNRRDRFPRGLRSASGRLEIVTLFTALTLAHAICIKSALENQSLLIPKGILANKSSVRKVILNGSLPDGAGEKHGNGAKNLKGAKLFPCFLPVTLTTLNNFINMMESSHYSLTLSH